MIKETIEYTDFNGNVLVEDFYFNMTKDELIQLGAKTGNSLEQRINDLIVSENMAEIYDIFRTIVLDAYGEKSDDGRRFVKSKELSEEFAQTNAFSELIFKMINDPEYATKFMEGLMPKDILDEVKKMEKLSNA